MIRFLIRLTGLLCLAGAFFFVIHDGTKSIADQRWYVSRGSDLWTMLHQPSLAQVEPTMRGMAPWLWDPVAVSILQAPIWLVLVILGGILILVGRKKRPMIGYSRR